MHVNNNIDKNRGNMLSAAVRRVRAIKYHRRPSYQNLVSAVQQIVSERMKFGKINPQVGHLQQVLYLRRIWIVVHVV